MGCWSSLRFRGSRSDRTVSAFRIPQWGFQDIADLSDLNYPVGMGGMKGITIKLPEVVARQLRLREQARQSGRSVAALIRDRIEAPPRDGGSVYAISADLAGSVAGRRLAATSARARFRRP